MSGELIAGLVGVVALVLAPYPIVMALDVMHKVAGDD